MIPIIEVPLEMDMSRVPALAKVEKLVVHTEGQVVFYKEPPPGGPRRIESPRGLDPRRFIYKADVDMAELAYWAVHGLGWSGPGYHACAINKRHSLYPDGTLMRGRPENKQGAHVEGLNARSLGICAIGNGEFEDFTEAQKVAISAWCAERVTEYKLVVSDVIGHRETRSFVRADQATSKTCPGSKVSMQEIRVRVAEMLVLGTDHPAPAALQPLIRAIVEERWRRRGEIAVEDVLRACDTLLRVTHHLREEDFAELRVVRGVLAGVRGFYA